MISSCSDSGTESGVEFGLAKEQIPSTAVDARDAEGGKYSRSSDCEIKFDEARYVDHKLHKLLGKCDTVNEIAAYIGMTESTATLTQWFKRWCTSEHGSTTTIIDADEQQCSSGTGVYNVGTVGYVNKYGDLVATYNANSGGQSKSLWGKNHYCNSGKSEGRTYSGLSSASCSASSNSTSTTSSTTSSSSYEGYVNKYGDLLAAFNRVGGSKVNWGKKHYCNYGRTEGRTYSGLVYFKL